MKKIIFRSLITAFLLLTGIYVFATIIDFSKTLTTDTFTKQDVTDTDMETANIPVAWGKINYETDRKNFEIYLFYPELVKEGNDFKVSKTQKIILYSLENYNECRNNGQTKIECIANAKTIIKNQANSYKEEIKEQLKFFQTEIEKEVVKKIDYKDELTIDDLIMTNKELNEP